MMDQNHDPTDNYARALSMAMQAILTHLFHDLEEKVLMTAGERNQILSDAIADQTGPPQSPLQARAVAILQEMKNAMNEGRK